MYFQKYGLQKRGLDNCLKSFLSDDPSRSNMVNKPKHYCNLNNSTFTIFIYHCEDNYGRKSLS